MPTTNPFLPLKSAVEQELSARRARNDYYTYTILTNFGFKPTRFHDYLCHKVQEFVETDTGNAYDILLLSVPPQHGKLEAYTDEILTSDGWKTFRNLRTGDYVYAPDGRKVRVLNELNRGQQASLLVTTSQGDKIKVHPAHEWVVYDRHKHGHPLCTVETREMIGKLDNNVVGRGHRYYYQLPEKKPLEGEEKELPIEPYWLGAWLGDGTTCRPTICAAPKDSIVLDECARYYDCKKPYTAHKTTGVLYAYYRGVSGALTALTGNRKYIPDQYLTASLRQRLELLAGLLDTDGYLDAKHCRYVFTTADERLRETFKSLIATFGWHVSEYATYPTTSTSGIEGKSVYWQLAFNPTIHIPCRLERKKLYTFKPQKREAIISIEPADPEPGKCITVEGGVYLTGRYLTPTHNSTSITETLPSWFLGRHPTASVIVAGYSGDFVMRFGRRNLDKIRQYGKAVFGDSYELADSPCNNSEFELANHKGRALFAGILGGITGNPANLVIIDDPIKTRQEAYSETTREAIKNEYLYSVKTRFSAGAKLIVIATRWVEDDLIGWLSENERNITVINIPCECEEPEKDPLGRKKGDALMPEIGKGRAWLEQFKESYLKQNGSMAWQAMFQGRPVNAQGNMWLRSWWRYFITPPSPDKGVIALSVDATFKESDDNDFCVVQVWHKVNEDFYLLDMVRKRMGFVDTLAAIRNLLSEYPDTTYIYVEDKANGSAIIDALSHEFSNVVAVNPEGGKASRAAAVSYIIENGRVHLPKFAAWLDDFLKETSAFPAGKHDDMVDAASQALNRLVLIEANVIPKKHRRYVQYSADMWEDFEKASPSLQQELLQLWGFPLEWREDEE